MKYHLLPLRTLTIALLALAAFQLSAANWGSLHGNNRSAPAAPAFHPQPQPSRAPEVNHGPPPAIHQEAVRPPETRPQVQPVREQPRQAVRPENHVEAHPVMESRTPARETDRRRMDIEEERRQSYFWSDYHAGMRIDRLPEGYRRFRLHDHDFFYFGGVYYDSGPSGYMVCAPPVDAAIPELPPGTETIQVGDTVYYYAAGAFYVQQSDGSFVVVAAPLGVTVALLPPDATSVVVNGVGYFQADGVYYQPVMQAGVTVYLTVPQP
jgi:hypothetical protein